MLTLLILQATYGWDIKDNGRTTKLQAGRGTPFSSFTTILFRDEGFFNLFAIFGFYLLLLDTQLRFLSRSLFLKWFNESILGLLQVMKLQQRIQAAQAGKAK